MGKAERELLESQALALICECKFYEFVDGIKEVEPDDLLAIIRGKVRCEACKS